MPKKEWFIHLSGETMGPISTDTVHKMIQQNRVGFLDFIFGEGMYQWSRISEVPEFQNDIPAFPKIPPPGVAGGTAPKKKAAPAKPARPAARVVRAVEVEEEVEEVAEEVYEEEAPEPVYAEEEAAEEEYVEEEPPPLLKRKPVPAPRVVQARPTPQPAPQPQPRAVRPAPVRPQPAPRPQPVELPETVNFKTKISVDDFGDYTCDSLGSKYVLVKSGEELPLGQEVKFVLQSNDLKKPRMMGIVIEQLETESGQSLQKIEFIKVNPIHRRAIEDYIKSSAPQPRVKKAS